MNEEINILGVFMPSILVCAVIAYAAMALMARVLRGLGAYEYVWHRPLFNLSIFVCFLGTCVLYLSKVHS
ncbi:MAG: DUF1656 domain-containing protein [Proteobacteria bacterium]|nr:DUF1656 domain-containing protein [Pseudomonadota bacterium]